MKNNYEINGEETIIYLNPRFENPLETTIETNDFQETDSYAGTWYGKWDKHTNGFYVLGNQFDPHTKTKTTISLHRFLMKTPSGYYTDHKSGNTLDNRRTNLRNCSNTENCYNRKPRVGCSSEFKGVMWDKQKKKWRSEIVVDRKRVFLGYFADETEAAQSYNQAALLYHREFAKLNHA